MNYSFIIPVYNRPDEIRELLQSFVELEGDHQFEIVIIEDGSTNSSAKIVKDFIPKLNIAYFIKENSGPGQSRNYGMRKASGDYFIILDSDCLVPPNYLLAVDDYLTDSFVDCFGGPDAANDSFNKLQRGINFAMTSILTTGGVRGGKGATKDFQPRSFNMGLSKKAFERTGGFGNIHPGEDPDLVLRLRKLNFKTALITDAFVYHKRRISWSKYYIQVYKFGLVRPILNKWHPETTKLIYWFPSLFLLGIFVAIFLATFGITWPLYIYGIYFSLIFIISLFTEKSLIVALNSLFAVCVQFIGYGYGFLKSSLLIGLLGNDPKDQFPKLFFDNV